LLSPKDLIHFLLVADEGRWPAVVYISEDGSCAGAHMRQCTVNGKVGAITLPKSLYTYISGL
jgi:hypothetical protein